MPGQFALGQHQMLQPADVVRYFVDGLDEQIPMSIEWHAGPPGNDEVKSAREILSERECIRTGCEIKKNARGVGAVNISRRLRSREEDDSLSSEEPSSWPLISNFAIKPCGPKPRNWPEI